MKFQAIIQILRIFVPSIEDVHQVLQQLFFRINTNGL